MYQAVKLPLALYFCFASQAEDRFDNGHPVAVDLFAVGAVDAMFHPVGVARSLSRVPR